MEKVKIFKSRKFRIILILLIIVLTPIIILYFISESYVYDFSRKGLIDDCSIYVPELECYYVGFLDDDANIAIYKLKNDKYKFLVGLPQLGLYKLEYKEQELLAYLYDSEGDQKFIKFIYHLNPNCLNFFPDYEEVHIPIDKK